MTFPGENIILQAPLWKRDLSQDVDGFSRFGEFRPCCGRGLHSLIVIQTIPIGRRTLRYAETHKQETRRRVLRVAARALRARGPDGFSVAEVMAQAGLTHGGFYAHFRSKEALIAAAIDQAFDEIRRRHFRRSAGTTDRQQLAAFVEAYLSPRHRNAPQRGCPIAALAGEMPRQGLVVRAAFDRGAADVLARLATWMVDAAAQDRPGLAASVMAEMVGALTLARAMDDRGASDQLLAECRRRVRGRVGLEADWPPAAAAGGDLSTP